MSASGRISTLFYGGHCSNTIMIRTLSRERAPKMRVFLRAIVLLVSTLVVINGQRDITQDDCGSRETCTSCIRSGNCAWCDVVVDERTTEPPIRCVNQTYAHDQHSNQWCSQGRPENRRMNGRKLEDEALSSSNNTKQVQIKPQRVRVQLRQGDEYRLKVQFRQAEDYPVDLYFLVDFSYSMQAFRQDLVRLTSRIVTAMEDLTSNIQLGFGSFVDKNRRPMIYDGRDWPGHYTFKNQLNLTKEYAKFEKKVQITPLVETYDSPEGGLEGMMQVIVCKEEIGWRPNARHLLVHASDDEPHVAGDGKFAGIIQPNDEECHLEENTGFYTHGELQDYPSLGQINWQARKNNINIIFATVSEHEEMYEAVKLGIRNSAVGVFAKGSDDIARLIGEQYEELVRTLTMTSNASSDFLDVKFFSKCLNKYGGLRQRNKCDGVRVGLTIDFEVRIKAIGCPKEKKDWNQIIQIKPEGINEQVIVELELICGCECSKKSDKSINAPRAEECHYHGVLDCGVCSCDRGYFGKRCQCEGDQASASNDALDASCHSDNSSKECSGIGNCICGSCNCPKGAKPEEKYYGKFCQCNDYSCRRSKKNRELCGGRGRCECGKCVCNSGWGGDACDCRDDTSLCLPPGENAKPCSGAGDCVCGKCKCHNETQKGRFCDECSSCPSQRCDQLKDCVECRVHKSGKIYAIGSNCSQCPDNIRPVDKVEEDQDETRSGKHVCRVAADDGSTFVFTYEYKDGEDKDPTILAEKDKMFRYFKGFVAVTLGVVLLTLFLGLLILLIWKVSTHIHDKREFEKFEKEREQAKWGQGQNPLYRTAVTTFQNPAFDAALENEDL